MKASSCLALAVILIAGGPCAAHGQAKAPPAPAPVVFCRQVLVLDVRPGYEGQALLIQICAPLSWWISNNRAERQRGDTGLMSGKDTTGIPRGGPGDSTKRLPCIRHTPSLRCPSRT